jgi:hypothetical protein
MRGLIIKDFINLKKNLKIMSALTVLYAVMAFMQEDTNFFSGVLIVVFAIMLLSTYSYDELSKWDSYALTMPLSRDIIVQGKYLVMLLLTLFGAGFSAVFSVIINFIMKRSDLMDSLKLCAAGASIVILFYSIILPFITKLVVEKARFIFFAVYMIPFLIAFLLQKQLKSGDLQIPHELIRLGNIFIQNVYIIVPLLLIAALGISYTISINIFRKKEF